MVNAKNEMKTPQFTALASLSGAGSKACTMRDNSSTDITDVKVIPQDVCFEEEGFCCYHDRNGWHCYDIVLV